jgi:hypothetical protein
VKLEYLPDGSPDCPLIRLYDFRPDEAGRLAAAIADLAAERAERVAVHGLSGVQMVGGYELVLRVGRRDAGMLRVGPAAFECRFTPGTWDNVAGLVEPFAAGADGYQWLARAPGEASLLLSPSGQW